MRVLLLLAAVLTLSACLTSDDSAGTTNPNVVTPAEMPADAADTDAMADSTSRR